MSLLGKLLRAVFSPEQTFADSNEGRDMEHPAPLRRLLPLIAKRADLEPDIIANLDAEPASPGVRNYRSFAFGGVDSMMVVETDRTDSPDEFICTYSWMLSSRFMVIYNISELLPVKFIMNQVRRQGHDGAYSYPLTKEIRTKLPTLAALFNNAERSDRNPERGLPMITFLDERRNYPLLAAYFPDSFLQKSGDMDRIHASLWKVLDKTVAEMNAAGILDATSRAFARTFSRIVRMAVAVGS